SLLGADYALILLLFISAASGLLLLALRYTAAMSVLLSLHLGVILSLFLVLPYTKFVHGIYRSAALLRNAAERPKPYFGSAGTGAAEQSRGGPPQRKATGHEHFRE